MESSGRTLLLEGLLPIDVWNTIIVILVLFGVFIAVFKGVTAIRDEVEKHKKKKELNSTDITDQIAAKVIEKVNDQIDEKFDSFEQKFDQKFDDIDTKLKADKQAIALHTTQLNDHETRVGKLEGGDKSLCQGVLALLEKDPTLEKAQHAMKNYLISGKYNEEDWK